MPSESRAAGSATGEDLGASLAAAGNFLTGVRIRSGALSSMTGVSEEVETQLAFGLESARRHLDHAAELLVTMQKRRPEQPHAPLSVSPEEDRRC